MDDPDGTPPRTRATRPTLLAAGAVLGALVAGGVGVASLAGGIVVAIVAGSVEPTVILAAFGSPLAGAALPTLLALRALELGVLLVVGVALAVVGGALAWRMLRRRADEARSIVRDGLLLTLVLVLVLGVASTALAWPSRLLDGDALTVESVAVACALGVLGVPVGAAMLVLADAMEARRAVARGRIEVVHVDFGTSAESGPQPR